jgi:hypothetical protein
MADQNPRVAQGARVPLTGRRNMSQILADELMRRVDEGQFPVGGRAPTIAAP